MGKKLAAVISILFMLLSNVFVFWINYDSNYVLRLAYEKTFDSGPTNKPLNEFYFWLNNGDTPIWVRVNRSLWWFVEYWFVDGITNNKDEDVIMSSYHPDNEYNSWQWNSPWYDFVLIKWWICLPNKDNLELWYPDGSSQNKNPVYNVSYSWIDYYCYEFVGTPGTNWPWIVVWWDEITTDKLDNLFSKIDVLDSSIFHWVSDTGNWYWSVDSSSSGTSWSGSGDSSWSSWWGNSYSIWNDLSTIADKEVIYDGSSTTVYYYVFNNNKIWNKIYGIDLKNAEEYINDNGIDISNVADNNEGIDTDFWWLANILNQNINGRSNNLYFVGIPSKKIQTAFDIIWVVGQILSRNFMGVWGVYWDWSWVHYDLIVFSWGVCFPDTAHWGITSLPSLKPNPFTTFTFDWITYECYDSKSLVMSMYNYTEAWTIAPSDEAAGIRLWLLLRYGYQPVGSNFSDDFVYTFDYSKLINSIDDITDKVNIPSFHQGDWVISLIPQYPSFATNEILKVNTTFSKVVTWFSTPKSIMFNVVFDINPTISKYIWIKFKGTGDYDFMKWCDTSSPFTDCWARFMPLSILDYSNLNWNLFQNIVSSIWISSILDYSYQINSFKNWDSLPSYDVILTPTDVCPLMINDKIWPFLKEYQVWYLSTWAIASWKIVYSDYWPFYVDLTKWKLINVNWYNYICFNRNEYQKYSSNWFKYNTTRLIFNLQLFNNGYTWDVSSITLPTNTDFYIKSIVVWNSLNDLWEILISTNWEKNWWSNWEKNWDWYYSFNKYNWVEPDWIYNLDVDLNEIKNNWWVIDIKKIIPLDSGIEIHKLIIQSWNKEEVNTSLEIPFEYLTWKIVKMIVTEDWHKAAYQLYYNPNQNKVKVIRICNPYWVPLNQLDEEKYKEVVRCRVAKLKEAFGSWDYDAILLDKDISDVYKWIAIFKKKNKKIPPIKEIFKKFVKNVDVRKALRELTDIKKINQLFNWF
jgi:hypothetical protein